MRSRGVESGCHKWRETCRKFYCLRQGTSKRGEVREGSLSSEETHARAGTLWHEGLACMVTK